MDGFSADAASVDSAEALARTPSRTGRPNRFLPFDDSRRAVSWKSKQDARAWTCLLLERSFQLFG
jgi:hypothetical protein